MKKFLDVILSTDLQEHKEKLLILLDNCLSIMWSLWYNIFFDWKNITYF
jgi:hypothetical protein